MEAGTHSHVKAFLRANPQCWVKAGIKGAGLSHTFLDGYSGGRIRVPGSLDTDFLESVARDVAQGTLPALNELRTPVFSFFVDFDIVVPAGKEVDARSVAAVTVRQVARFTPGLDAYAVVLTTTPLVKDGGALVKHGVHLHFPTVHIRMHEALLMREAVIVALEREKGCEVDWATAYDNAPYNHEVGGLRMIGAPKVSKCPKCRNVASEREHCFETTDGGCACKGHIVEGRRYGLLCVLGVDGEQHPRMDALCRSNVAVLVRACSIRLPEGTPVSDAWREFDGCPHYSALKQAAHRPTTVGNKRRRFDEEKASAKHWPKKVIDDAQKRDRITAIFRRFDPVYANVCVTSLRADAKLTRIFAQFTGEGENYCLNLRANHKSNRVYGVVERTHAYIRCHCTCNTIEGRRSGRPCRDFKSEPKHLTKNEMECIFGPDKVAIGGAVGNGMSQKAHVTKTAQSFLADLAAKAL